MGVCSGATYRAWSFEFDGHFKGAQNQLGPKAKAFSSPLHD